MIALFWSDMVELVRRSEEDAANNINGFVRGPLEQNPSVERILLKYDTSYGSQRLEINYPVQLNLSQSNSISQLLVCVCT